MSHQTRRSFLKKTAALGVATTFTISGTKASGRVLGTNDTARVACVGIHGRGSAHMGAYAKMDKTDVVALVDVDSRLFDQRSKMIKEKGGNTPNCYQDLREALEKEQLDAVSIATTNHTHSLLAIWSAQAGVNAYVEKPCSHNIFEGRKLVEAARKYNVLMQHGTQSRASSGIAKEIAAVHSEKYGKLQVVRGFCCKPRWSIGFKPNQTPPAGLDYNLWLGPAPELPYNDNFVHYNWHWFWPFGAGDMGNQGVHQMDIARWAIKDATLPKSVWSAGGRYVEGDGFKDQAETPNMLLDVLDFGDVKLVFETRGLVKSSRNGVDAFPLKVAVEYFTTEGRIAGGQFHPKDGGKPEKLEAINPESYPKTDLFHNFLSTIRNGGKPEDLYAEIEKGHYSSALCHLGNISYRLGKQTSFKDEPTQLAGSHEKVKESWATICDNMTAVGIEPSKLYYTQGQMLEFDAKAEKFVNNPEADKLLTRDYRKPFVVPENV